MSINQQLRDAMLGHAIDLTHYSNAQARTIITILNGRDAELKSRLIDAMENVGTVLTVEVMNQVLSAVLQVNATAFLEVNEALNRNLDDLLVYELSFQQALVESVLPRAVQVQFPVVSVAFSSAKAIVQARPFQGRLLKEWMAGIEADRAARIRDAIRSGVVEGRTTSDIVKQIVGRKSENFEDGLLQRSRRDVETIVRSAIGHTAETASDAAYEANSDIISHVQWLSTLDNKTSSTCRIRDQLPYTLKTYKPIGHKIPWLAGPGRIHMCCRSTKFPVLKSAAALGFDDGATRASMNGQVPASTTYAEWLSKQSAGRQDQILGVTRAQMMREGGLKLDAFYNDKGKLLTLEQLRERLK